MSKARPFRRVIETGGFLLPPVLCAHVAHGTAREESCAFTRAACHRCRRSCAAVNANSCPIFSVNHLLTGSATFTRAKSIPFASRKARDTSCRSRKNPATASDADESTRGRHASGTLNLILGGASIRRMKQFPSTLCQRGLRVLNPQARASRAALRMPCSEC
jgi:hypothetical protein